MKKIFLTILAVVILVAGCESVSVDTPDTILDDVSTATIAEAITAEIEIPSAVGKKTEDMEFFISELDTSYIVELSYLICASGAYPDELLIIKFKTSTDANTAKSAVQGRLDSQKETFRDYAPAEMYKFDDAVIQASSNWLFFYITENNAKVKEIINSYL